jgi:hypothetical protein
VWIALGFGALITVIWEVILRDFWGDNLRDLRKPDQAVRPVEL